MFRGERKRIKAKDENSRAKNEWQGIILQERLLPSNYNPIIIMMIMLTLL